MDSHWVKCFARTFLLAARRFDRAMSAIIQLSVTTLAVYNDNFVILPVRRMSCTTLVVNKRGIHRLMEVMQQQQILTNALS